MLAGDVPNFDGLNARHKAVPMTPQPRLLLALIAEFEGRSSMASAGQKQRVQHPAKWRQHSSALKLNQGPPLPASSTSASVPGGLNRWSLRLYPH